MLTKMNFDERVEAFNRMTQEALLSVAPVYTRPIDLTRQERARWAQGNARADADWVTVEARHRTLRLRVFRSSVSPTVCLHIHGGGWVFGGPDQQDALLHAISEGAGITIMSLEYRLAPEHRFPAGLDDVTDALLALLAASPPESGAPSVVVMGESAGANLLISALARVRGHPGFSRIRCVCLNYGTYDLTGSASLRSAGPESPLLNRELVSWFCLQYTGQEQSAHPEVSPMHAALASLEGMPPALFLVGSADAVRDDSVLMSERWRAAGNLSEVAVIQDGLHGLLEFNTPVTQQGRQLIVGFIGRACAV